jgi:hypothetical protein
VVAVSVGVGSGTGSTDAGALAATAAGVGSGAGGGSVGGVAGACAATSAAVTGSATGAAFVGGGAAAAAFLGVTFFFGDAVFLAAGAVGFVLAFFLALGAGPSAGSLITLWTMVPSASAIRRACCSFSAV